MKVVGSDRSRGVALVICSVCLAVSGCFSGEYTRRMEETINDLQRDTEKARAVFGQPSKIVDAAGTATGVSLRMPVFVDDTAKPLVADAPHAQPPFVELPGFAYAYEVPMDGPPAYVYFAAVKPDEKSAEELAQQVQGAIRNTFSGASWEQVNVETFAGDTQSLRRLRVKGPQQFGTTKTEGQFDLYLVSSSEYHVLIGWRASMEAARNQGIFDKVAIAMGSIQGAN